jgi:4-carboxymuconolactone decarboxylase
MRLGLLAFFVTCIIRAQEPAKAAPVKPPPAPKQLQLRGDRFQGLTYGEMTSEQKALTDRALAGRGTIGTFNILLRSPGLSEAVRGTAGGRAGSPLSTKQAELAIIINARYWTTQFEWLVHHRAAVQAGVSEATVAAIAEGRRPASMPPDEEPVYNFVRELLKTKQVSDPTFAAAKALLGESGIVDLIGLVGFYQSTSLMMNVDRYPMQADQKPELKKLESPLP